MLVVVACVLSSAVLTRLPGIAAASGTQGIPSFDGGTGWLNGNPLSPADLRGKVVLVDVWEYTCINCLRTLPYLTAWYRRYRDDGFVIVGVHTPEFNFSGDEHNVAAAIKRLGVTWPVVLDDHESIWKRYNAMGWPSEYLFDQSGKLVDTEVGEGNYQATEAKIQALLRAKNPSLRLPPVMALLPQDSYDKPGAVCYPHTAETFVGPWHGLVVANAGAANDPSVDTDYMDSGASHRDGSVYLQGYWHAAQRMQAMVSGGGNGYLSLTYHAIQVVAVMKPETAAAVRVNVTQDGKPVAHEDAGSDIRYDEGGSSYVTVDAARAYELIMNRHFGQHALRLLPERSGVGIYDFAFEACEVGSDK